MQDTCGVPVVVRSGMKVLIVVAGTLLEGRFLFLPAQVALGDRVWLRIEKVAGHHGLQADASGAAHVSAHVTQVWGGDIAHDHPVRSLRVAPGARFSVTFDEIEAAALSDGPTRVRWVSGDGAVEVPDDDDDDLEPTDPTAPTAALRTSLLATTPDLEALTGTSGCPRERTGTATLL